MFKTISISLLVISLIGRTAQAVQCPTFPNPLTNGTTADANAVMADLMYLQDCPALGTNPSFTGNVGIGTTSPSNPLTVSSTGPNAIAIISNNTNSTGINISNTYSGGHNWSLASSGGGPAPAGDFVFYDNTSGGPRLTIDMSGNVGIGTTNPRYLLDVRGNMMVRPSSGAASLQLQDGVPTTTGTLSHSSSLFQISDNANPVEIDANTNGGVAGQLYLATNGSVGIGTTNPAEALDTGTGIVRSYGFRGRAGYGGATSNVFNINWTGSAAQLWIDYTNVGTISTVSDRRLKQQIATEPDTGLARIMQLRPVTFHWRNADIFHDDGVQHEGFIADELQTVIPSAVVNKKDQVDAKGKPVYQSIVPSEIIPVLTKALQEQQKAMQAQQAEIDTLKSQIVALQAAQSSAH